MKMCIVTLPRGGFNEYAMFHKFFRPQDLLYFSMENLTRPVYGGICFENTGS